MEEKSTQKMSQGGGKETDTPDRSVMHVDSYLVDRKQRTKTRRKKSGKDESA